MRLLAALGTALLLSCGAAVDDDVRGMLGALAGQADAAAQPVVVGADGWLLLASELRHLSLGTFWGERAASVSRATRREWADPLAAIVDFHAQLRGAGIDLLLVPVPAKAAVHPESVPGLSALAGSARVDSSDAAFYRVLREAGVSVLDLAPAFRRVQPDEPRALYCRQDSHWSGAGCEAAALQIARLVRERTWFEDVPKRAFDRERREVEMDGDLRRMLGDTGLPLERLSLRFVGERGADAALVPVAPWRQSPVLLLADSHGLVFHAGGDMHARGAGLADQLALELGFPVDLVAVRGSGATPARIALLRRGDGLAGKRLVIWCISVREFTETPQGWRPIPVIPDSSRLP